MPHSRVPETHPDPAICRENPSQLGTPFQRPCRAPATRSGSMIPTVKRRTGRSSCARINVPSFLGIWRPPRRSLRTGNLIVLTPNIPVYRSIYTCLLFDHLDAARRFCEKKVRDLPSLICEVFDPGGRVEPPLLVIMHSDYEGDEDSGPASSRRRKLIVAGLLLAGAALISVNLWRESILATLLAFNCVLSACASFTGSTP